MNLTRTFCRRTDGQHETWCGARIDDPSVPPRCTCGPDDNGGAHWVDCPVLSGGAP